jgi:hypothetical protein
MSSVTAGGTLVSDLKRGVQYPLTMSVKTAVVGAVLFVASVVVLPLPLFLGYVAAAAGHSADDEPLPEFDGSGLYVRGLGLIAVFGVFLFGTLVLAGVVAAALGRGQAADAVAGLLLLGWFYATPWLLGVYGAGSWRDFLDRTSWQWLRSADYVLTVLAAAVVAGVGYFVFLASVFTIVGWTVVGFLFPVMTAALVGGRYRHYRERVGTPTVATDADTGDVRDRSGPETNRDRPGSSGASAPATADDGGTESPTASSESTDESAGGDTAAAASGDEPAGEYAQLRDGATHVGRDGPLVRYEADGGRVRFLALADEHDGDDARGAFDQAVERWDGVAHNPRVATVFETGDEPAQWVAFEGLDGPLSAFGGDLSRAEAVAVVAAVKDGLTTGRRYNVAHGDLHPDCVFVERGGGSASAGERVDAVVSDWGVHRELVAATGADGRPVRYVAPEQFGGAAADQRVDVYQLAAVAHYALFGRPPFAAADDDALAAADRDVVWSAPDGIAVSDELAAVFRQALATDPAERYDGIGAFVRAFRSAVQ